MESLTWRAPASTEWLQWLHWPDWTSPWFLSVQISNKKPHIYLFVNSRLPLRGNKYPLVRNSIFRHIWVNSSLSGVFYLQEPHIKLSLAECCSFPLRRLQPPC